VTAGRTVVPTEDVLALEPFEVSIDVEDGQWAGRCDELGILLRGDITDTDATVGEKLNQKIRDIAAGYDLPDAELAPEAYDMKTRFIEAGWIAPQLRGPRPTPSA
jgi:hypothetical protein